MKSLKYLVLCSVMILLDVSSASGDSKADCKNIPKQNFFSCCAIPEIIPESKFQEALEASKIEGASDELSFCKMSEKLFEVVGVSKNGAFDMDVALSLVNEKLKDQKEWITPINAAIKECVDITKHSDHIQKVIGFTKDKCDAANSIIAACTVINVVATCPKSALDTNQHCTDGVNFVHSCHHEGEAMTKLAHELVMMAMKK